MTREIITPLTRIRRCALTAEVVEREAEPGAWGVEAINDEHGDGEIYMAVFHGPDSYELAMEYAGAKYIHVCTKAAE